MHVLLGRSGYPRRKAIKQLVDKRFAVAFRA